MAKQKVISVFELLRLIRDARSTKHSTRIVLNALALRANPATRHSCFPGQPQIVVDTQLDLKTVRTALASLEAAKLIATKKRFNTSDLYFINVALLQRQAAESKPIKDEIPECPFEDPTMEQERQLNADEEKISFDDDPDTDSTHTEEPDNVEPSPISAAIQALEYVSEKMTVKDADRMAASLLRSHDEENVLQAIASLDNYALIEAYKAKNPIGYLRTCINDALVDKKEADIADPKDLSSDEDMTAFLTKARETGESMPIQFTSDYPAAAIRATIEQIRRLGGSEFDVSELERDEEGQYLWIYPPQSKSIEVCVNEA